ncbi:J domain-containing protein [Halobaculum magnesiiphilum]|uniref:J domain-containing protein n=1 Tax=Halobaculum magnesiiphilum TaxID=1017351 RepID=A0A8T8WBM4_9EURY|nr:J domain-containing protein [Halobaculum magnesiiphilum]QZP37272.1 J domain-containing protein [Halobaculum magnesiiphilum]
MIGEWLAALPGWLVWGVAAGVVASAGVAGVFLAANRLFPDPPARTGSRDQGSLRRKAEIRDYLRRIDERFVENADLDGTRVEFYLPERDVALTFDVHAYFGIRDDEDRHTRVILCEHEMPGRHLGRRLPFEVPDLHLGPDPTARPVTAAFDTLELPATADEESVERAYREKVKETHPDQGGSREAFSEVREAYATALDHAEESSGTGRGRA